MTDARKTESETCERLGALAAASCPDGRVPDADQWAAIEARLGRATGRRRLWPALAVATVALTGVLAWAAFRQTLGYQSHACAVAGDRLTSLGQGAVRFADGSTLALPRGSAVRVEPLPFARGAELALDDGELEVSVVHRRIGRWAVRAGPFRIDVTGTRFAVRWSKHEGRLRLAMEDGEVVVGGGPVPPGTRLRAGQVLEADAGHFELGDGRKPAAPPSAGASAEAPPQTPPPVPASGPAPPPTAERPRRSPSTAPSRRPAARSPEQRPAAVPISPPEPPALTARPEPVLPPAPVPPRPAPVTPPPLPSTVVVPPRPAPNAPWRITIAPDGQLGAGMDGYAWLSSGEGTAPVANLRHTRLQAVEGKLCTQGRLSRWSCVNEGMPTLRCNWDRNWGVAIGFFTAADGGAWGAAAPGGLALEFRGRSGPYRLNVHRKGDPPDRVFCVESYKSGQVVRPAAAKTRCWDDLGEPLDSFHDVDHVSLQFPSGLDYVAFRYCISGVTLYP